MDLGKQFHLRECGQYYLGRDHSWLVFCWRRVVRPPYHFGTQASPDPPAAFHRLSPFAPLQFGKPKQRLESESLMF